ncbi:MAG: L-lactate permease [Candidatus Izemoplasma sp.]|nr:L-lactate permease [Candidatus Izemoplasma sp.]
MNLFVSLLPILLPFLFLVLLKMPAKKGMTLSFLIVLIGAYFFWDMSQVTLLASIIQGTHKAFGILIILFGAIIMMNILQMNGAIDRINLWFDELTQDMRIQAILIAFIFGGLIEGVAGFGTPAVVVAPLLVALGFKPITAAALALVSNSVPVPFAAVGTPIKIGLGNISTSTDFLNEVARTITSIEFLAGAFMPTIIVFMLLFFFAKDSKKQDYFEILPWTLFIGFTYTLVAKLVSITLGYEFVTIITVLIMLAISIASIKLGFLIPKHKWQNANEREEDLTESDMSIIRAWLPYAIVILLLIISRVIAPVKTFFQSAIDLSINNILGIAEISSSLQLLYSPGFILIVVAISSVFIQKSSTKNIKAASLLSLNTVKGAALALVPTLSMVQIFSNSGINLSDLESMPVYLATFLGEHLSGIWVFLAPYIGELGSFITGSATVSTLTFSPVQYQIALDYGLNGTVILALQLLGGAAGNMICVHNVVSVATVVGVEGEEGNIINKTLLPALLYGFLVGLSAFILF